MADEPRDHQIEVSPVPGFTIADDPLSITGGAVYILILSYNRKMTVDVGALGTITFERGSYAYCGSAKSGLRGRVMRHLSDPARKHWHIDHIASLSTARKVFWKGYSSEGECGAAGYLQARYRGVKGFGCSDCKCDSHLFFLGEDGITS